MTDMMTLLTSGDRKFVKQEMRKVLDLETDITKVFYMLLLLLLLIVLVVYFKDT